MILFLLWLSYPISRQKKIPSVKWDFINDTFTFLLHSIAAVVVNAIKESPEMHILALNGNTVGVEAAAAIAKALEDKSELQVNV